jgi:putative ABC transport system permease protein
MAFATLDQDLRYAWRVVSKRRAFNAGLVATIALVIGASTAILATLDGLLLRQFPFKDADRLVTLWESNRETGVQHLAMSEYAYPVFRQRLTAFSGIGGFVAPTPDLPPWKLADTGERIAAILATPEMFDVLGTTALKGRVFSAADGRPEAPRVAVLGYRFWMTHFGGTANAIGREVIVNQWGRRVHYVVVGVMPDGFEFPHPLFPDRPDLWTIARYGPPPSTFSRSNAFYVVAKLGKSVPLAQARADVNRVARQIAMEQPRAYGSQSVEVLPLRSEALRDAKAVVGALLAAFLFITLIGCANIVHLVMAGAAARRRDAAIRISVGANRVDVFRPAALELGILFAIGGALGLVVAYWGLKLLPSLLPPQLYIPRADALASQAPALLFASGAALVAALALGMGLSRGVYRPSVNDELRGVAGPTGSNRSMFRRGGTILLVCQVAFAFALGSGALAMVNSLAKFLEKASPIDPQRLLAVEVVFAQSVPIDNSRAAYQGFLLNQNPVNGIEAIGVVDRYPLGDQTTNSFKAEGAPGPIGTTAQPADVHIVSPSYAHVFGIQLREGRWFADSDGPDAGPVVVINEAMARHYFPGVSPIGAVLHEGQWLIRDRVVGWQVVGVVREERRFASERDVPPSVYVPVAQAFMRNVTIVVRTSVPARKVAAAVRDRVVRMLPGVSVERLQTGSNILADLTARSRFVSQQLTALALVALVLASAGIYSVVSFRNSRRTREIAVRMALGSTRRQVVFLVVRETLAMVAVGIAAGIPMAIGLGRVLASLRYDARPLDVLPYLVATAIFCCAGLAAALPPSRRAATVEPMEVLRSE